MRYSEEHKDAVRARIVEQAAMALRDRGIDGLGIPALMKRAGLTHGGFYCHFKERDELVSAAVRFAAEQTAERVLDAPEHDLRGMVAAYLSESHRDHPEVGCVVAALGAEARHQGPAVRRTFAEVARGFLHKIQRRLHPRLPATDLRDDALELAARMVGALVLSRLVEDDVLSERILGVARRL